MKVRCVVCVHLSMYVGVMFLLYLLSFVVVMRFRMCSCACVVVCVVLVCIVLSVCIDCLFDVFVCALFPMVCAWRCVLLFSFMCVVRFGLFFVCVPLFVVVCVVVLFRV